MVLTANGVYLQLPANESVLKGPPVYTSGSDLGRFVTLTIGKTDDLKIEQPNSDFWFYELEQKWSK